MTQSDSKGVVSGLPPTLSTTLSYIVKVIAVLTSLFYLYTAIFGLFPAITQRGLLLLPSILILFWGKPLAGWRSFWSSLVVVLLCVASITTIIFEQEALLFRGGEASDLDLIAGMLLILTVIFGVKRCGGWPLTILVLLFLVYVSFGNIPGILAHKSFTTSYIISNISLGTQGIWGLALSVCASYVFPFVILASFFRATGTGEAFIKLSTALVGRTRGGPAKIAVLASGFFGSISGSAVANVAAVGTLTIPLMKQLGYRSEFAGGVEGVSSTGGQFMPPIMAASAFIIAEVLNLPYFKVALAAAIPAILYYVAILIMVDLEAVKSGLKGLAPGEVPSLGQVLRTYWSQLVPLVYLIYALLIKGYSPGKASIITIVLCVITSWLNKNYRVDLPKFITAMEEGTRGMASIAAICAGAGIIMGTIDLVGLPMKMATILITLASGHLSVLLVLSMVASIILGMGLPTVAAYVILAVMVAPALLDFGIVPIAAHLFIFYYGILSFITPPVALASYVAAGIAGADPVKTSWEAIKLGIAGLVVPYVFIYNPAMLLQGKLLEILVVTLCALVSIFFMAMSVQGYMFGRLLFFERGLLLAGSIMILFPDWRIRIAGFIIGCCIALIRFNQSRKCLSDMTKESGNVEVSR